MAFSFFSLFDDISALMDDIAVNTKIATKETAGVLGDDLAVNAAQVSKFSASRELPIIFKITKGSFINKLIIIPIMLSLSIFLPSVVVPILILGGIYLSFEGAKGFLHLIFPNKEEQSQSNISEKEKIKSAILTDFILSIEIVLIALSVVINKPILVQIAVVTIVSFLATIGVYGIVALLIRLDDIGLDLAKNEPTSSFKYRFGMALVVALPKIVKVIEVIGIFAMLLVAGGIFLHHIEILKEIFNPIPSMIAEILISAFIGTILIAIKSIYLKLFK